MEYGYGQYPGQPVRGGAAGVARGAKGHGSVDEEVRNMEYDAYNAVLRVCMLSELNWARDALLTQLRKEFNISSDLHDDIKLQILQDPNMGRIREGLQNPSAPAAKKMRTGPGPSGYPQTASPAPQPKSNLPAPKRPPPGAKTPSSSKKPPASKAAAPKAGLQAPPVGANMVVNPDVGKSCKRHWPNDGWYQAVITDYRPHTDEHCLVYDINTLDESFEWVRLAELKKNEFQWLSDRPNPEVFQTPGGGSMLAKSDKPASKPPPPRNRGGSSKKPSASNATPPAAAPPLDNIVDQVRNLDADQLNGVEIDLKDREAEIQRQLAALADDDDDSDSDDEQMS